MDKYIFAKAARKLIGRERPVIKQKAHYRTGQERFEERYPNWRYIGVGAMMTPARRYGQ